MPRGMRWLLGGGSKTRGLLAVRQAAEAEADFTRAEARSRSGTCRSGNGIWSRRSSPPAPWPATSPPTKS
jgi:hypothetical protein